MAGFLTPLQLQFIDGKHWAVLSPFEYRLGTEDGEESIIIPIGFETDFASIPRGLWNIFPPAGPYGKAAVIHDWMYQYRTVLTPTGTRLCDRGEADRALREGMEVLGCGWTTRHVIYTGVRLGGWRPWRTYRSQE